MCQSWLHLQQLHFEVFFKLPPCFRHQCINCTACPYPFWSIIEPPASYTPTEAHPTSVSQDLSQHWRGGFTWSLGCDKWPITAWGARQMPPAQWWWQLASFLDPAGMCRGGSSGCRVSRSSLAAECPNPKVSHPLKLFTCKMLCFLDHLWSGVALIIQELK